MPEKRDNPFNFFQELKRRKVFRVLTVYAAAAFIIIEVSNNITDSLHLPDWVSKWVVILLGIGLLIAIIVSWIFDITPVGIEKTKPIKEIQTEARPISSNTWKVATFISLTIIVALLSYNLITTINRTRNLQKLEKSIAVLPFVNMSEDTAYSHMGDAITNEVILELQKIKEFDRVLSRTSTMQFRDTKLTIPDIAEKLGVNYIIEGSIQRHLDDVSIRIQVIRSKQEDHIWGDKYDSKWDNIFSIQNEIAYNVAHELKIALSTEEIDQIEKKPTESTIAYNYYLLGDHFLKQQTPEGLNKAVEYFENAIQMDSTYAMPYVGLAQCYQFMVRYGFLPLNKGYQNTAKGAILKAIELDESLGEAYATLGLMMIVLDWDIDGPEQLFQKAIKLNPNSVEVYNSYAQYLRYVGRYSEGISMAKQAINLDPLTPNTNLWLGMNHLAAGNYNDFIDNALFVLELDSSFMGVDHNLACSYALKGMYSEAIDYADKAMSIPPLMNNPGMLSVTGWVYAKSGRREIAQEHLKQLLKSSDVDPVYMAIIYTGLGENDEAFNWLLKAYEARSGQTIYLKAYSNHYFKDLSADPRYIDLLKKIGFKI